MTDRTQSLQEWRQKLLPPAEQDATTDPAPEPGTPAEAVSDRQQLVRDLTNHHQEQS